MQDFADPEPDRASRPRTGFVSRRTQRLTEGFEANLSSRGSLHAGRRSSLMPDHGAIEVTDLSHRNPGGRPAYGCIRHASFRPRYGGSPAARSRPQQRPGGHGSRQPQACSAQAVGGTSLPRSSPSKEEAARLVMSLGHWRIALRHR